MCHKHESFLVPENKKPDNNYNDYREGMGALCWCIVSFVIGIALEFWATILYFRATP